VLAGVDAELRPRPQKTVFEFVCLGFDALGYEEHVDYDLVQSANPAFNKAVVRVNVYRTHRQTIQYIQPSDHAMLGQAELVVIDEAAAIPLPLVRKLLGNYLVFMASTINGYEGTGRSLSLKLIKQLRQQSSAAAATATGATQGQGQQGASVSSSGGACCAVLFHHHVV
jgi:N-acetyltransferase 10